VNVAVIDPDPSVNAIGVVEYSNGAIEKCVLSGTAKTKYLTEGLRPPNKPPENITFNPGQILAVESQVIRLVADDVAVQVLVVIVAVSANMLV
jgi:hypothetical protein